MEIMKKGKIFRALLFIGCLSSCLFAVTACKKNKVVDMRPTIEGVSFVESTVKKGPKFLDGSLHEVAVGSTIVLKEYVLFTGDSYKLTITDQDGNVTDLSKSSYWMADEVGQYVFTYKITSGDNAGTATFDLAVVNPPLTWQFTLQNLPYNYGDELVFEEYFGRMNIYTSLPNCEVIMDSVEIDGETIDLTDRESYVFESRSDHIFKFHAEAPDGQICEGRETISIKYVDQDYLQELTDMGISLNGDLYVERGAFTMVAGSYCNGNNVILRRSNGPHYSPYIAYDGEFGIGSYVKVDFTGKNMPIFSFFRDEYSSSLFDGSKGIVFTGGLKNNNGAIGHPTLSKNGVLYGPNMLNKPDEAFGADFRDTAYIADAAHIEGGAHPISLEALQDGTRYRMIIGFSGIDKTTAGHLFTKEPTESVRLTLQCVLIDLDNKQVATKFTMHTYALQALGFENVIPVDVEDNEYFKGSIVLYGNYGARTVLDAIYPIITNTELSFEELFADELQYSQFKAGAKSTAFGNSCEITVSDYVDTSSDNYQFYYEDANGARHEVDSDKFTLSTPGSYIFYYSDGEHLRASLPFNLIEVSENIYNWINANNMSLHGLSEIAEDHSLVLKAGTLGNGATYHGPNPGLLVDQAYVAFDGNYSFDDYVAFDFTGKNMPEVAFFAQNYNNSMYYQNGGKHGIVFANGITTFDGQINESVLKGSTCVNIDSPFMIEGVNDSWYKMGGDVVSQLARANLVDNAKYRVILGYTKGSSHGSNGITLHWVLYNRETCELVEQGKIETYNFYTGKTASVNNMTLNDLFGSIVLYGKFGTELSIDKLYGVFENTTIEAVASALNENKTFNVTFKGVNGEVLKTLTNVPAGELVTYGDAMPTPPRTEDAAFFYEYVWDKPLSLITQDMTYTLKVAAVPKNSVKTHMSYVNGASITLGAGEIGQGANYTIGQNAGGSISQAYLAIEGNYGFNDYIVFDFTGKNMPEVMFFANNYDGSIYYSAGKQGIVVASGITLWDGSLCNTFGNNTRVAVSGPFGAYYEGAAAPHGGNMMEAFTAKLARANLVDGVQYRIIMGFVKGDTTFTLKYCLYNLTDNVVVENVSQESWAFFTGSNDAVANMTLDGFSGSIVLYGKFKTETQIDRFCGLYEDSSIESIMQELGMN